MHAAIHNHSHNHGFLQSRISAQINASQSGSGQAQSTRGERLVARLDSDQDGKLNVQELADTKLGRRLSIDRFARIDTDGDSQLSATELDNARKSRGGGSTADKEAEMRQRYADYLTQKADTTTPQADIADRVLNKLDGDKSGGLNSEEIAGTRLAEIIGADFYNVDVDKSGALDKAELSEFIAGHLTGPAKDSTTTTEPDTTGPVSDAPSTGVSAAAAPPPPPPLPPASEIDVTTDTADISDANDTTTTTSVPGAGTAEPSYVQGIKDAFEAALKILQDGQNAQSPYNVVQTLYGDVQNILNNS